MIGHQLRDALHYHRYNLEAWLWILLVAPEMIDSRGREAIGEAVNFLRPYFVGEKVHIEFICTKTPFDIERRQNEIPEYQNVPWKPETARKTLNLAASVFPQVRAWAPSLDKNSHLPWIKLLMASSKADSH